MEYIAWLAIIAIAIYLFGRKRQRPLAEEVGKIRGIGDFDLEVVGESHYQDALRNALDALPGRRKICEATLVMEDDNPHDPKAVAVFISGNQVGYLDRDAARTFRKHIAGQNLPAGNYTCQAKLFGGTKTKPSIGVWLDVYKPPH